VNIEGCAVGIAKHLGDVGAFLLSTGSQTMRRTPACCALHDWQFAERLHRHGQPVFHPEERFGAAQLVVSAAVRDARLRDTAPTPR
jgi:hypothetical protein